MTNENFGMNWLKTSVTGIVLVIILWTLAILFSWEVPTYPIKIINIPDLQLRIILDLTGVVAWAGILCLLPPRIVFDIEDSYGSLKILALGYSFAQGLNFGIYNGLLLGAIMGIVFGVITWGILLAALHLLTKLKGGKKWKRV